MRLPLLLACLAIICLDKNQASAAGNTDSINVGLKITGLTNTSQPVKARYTCNAARTKITMAGHKYPDILDCQTVPYRFVSAQNETKTLFNFNPVTGVFNVYQSD